MGAAALPVMAMSGPFMDMVTPPVDRPGAPNRTQLDMLPEYRQKILQGGFDPQSELYRLAGEQQAARLNREFSRRGLSNSSLALGAQSQAATDLSNRFLEGEQARRIQAYQTAMAPSLAQAQLDDRYNNMLANRDMAFYGQDLAAREKKVQGFGNMMGSVAGFAGSGGFGGMGGGGMSLPANSAGGSYMNVSGLA